MFFLVCFRLCVLTLAVITPSLAVVPTRYGVKITHPQLVIFRPDDTLRPVHQHSIGSTYPDLIFHGDEPVFYPREGSSSSVRASRNGVSPSEYYLSELQRGIADFGKIHVVGNPDKGEHPLTIIKGGDGSVVIRDAERAVQQRATQIHSIHQTFGRTAAIVAFGSKLDKAGKKGILGRRKSAPIWKTVQSTDAVSGELGYNAVNALLNEQRHVRFRRSDGRELWIRLRPDGSREAKMFESSLEPAFRVHP
ncbi:uncharacterized protein MEPE_03950 [Melanopsichium pennsylvanicum]|uniref:Uncharacterized protein n=1 Tax=Melanopsichium pennsylvanicum TaxID=63383 RepID=A0AAJ4XNX5_9BASI|nr:uncharacterized protein MEPE_03950 [Melanopsichium pennsylvanicum]